MSLIALRPSPSGRNSRDVFRTGRCVPPGSAGGRTNHGVEARLSSDHDGLNEEKPFPEAFAVAVAQTPLNNRVPGGYEVDAD
jgi:hypothetical protein